MKNEKEVIDVLICVAERDINFLLEYSIKSCIQNFRLLGDIHIVTNAKEKMEKQIEEWGGLECGIHVWKDEDILDAEYMYLNGWYKQQLIKLHSDSICKTRYICCFGADAVVLQPIEWEDLFDGEDQKLFFNRYKKPCVHLEYERSRLEGVSDILQVSPERSYLLGDFIMELMIFDSRILNGLRKYLEKLYGEYPFRKVINNITDDIVEGNKFGEWSLYSMYVLDVLKKKISVCNSRNEFVTQLHSQSDILLYDYHSKIIHFVSKSFSKEQILKTIRKYCEINHIRKENIGGLIND